MFLNGGGRGIRTPGTVSRTVVFKTTRFNRSRIPPQLSERLSFVSIRTYQRVSIARSIGGSRSRI